MRVLIIVLLAVASMGFAACGGDDDSTATPSRTAGPSAAPIPTQNGTATIGQSPAGDSPFVVGVKLQDYQVAPAPNAGPAGRFEFQITNSGPSAHEFVVVKTDLAAADLPTNGDGAVKEDNAEIEKIDEVEAVNANGTAKLTVELDAGKYVFFCNVVEQGGGGSIAHYTQGMRTTFTVQ